MAVIETKHDILTWRAHPARERPAAACFALFVVVGVTWMVAEIMGNPWWGVLPAVFFLVTLQRFFLPSEFHVDDEGVSARSAFASSKIRWRDIRRFQHDNAGAFLSPRRRASMFDGFRGLHLMFVGNHEQVVRRIEAGMECQTE